MPLRIAVTRAIAVACPNLEWFNASYSSIDDEGASSLIQSCHNLRVLQLRCCQLIRGKDWLEDIGARLPKVQYVNLDFRNCSKKVDEAQRLYPKVCFCSSYRDCRPYDGRVWLNEHTFVEILSEVPSLSDLKMERVKFPDIVGEAVRRELEETM
jgi:hypothetical protein